ncbi:MAG: hypothetical protein IT258_18365 [Saprospiraceae bacterium]|nr:hypothetical protein [Saprospiraceae bacterium]
MSAKPVTIEKNPSLLPSEDYYFLRTKGIEYIEQMGSRLWTDYNSHDPGITMLEALCYAISELGYKAGWSVEDLLAGNAGADQPFFTAKDILTCNPLTINDFRKLLVDIVGVSNAWLVCKDCACEVQLFADCENGRLAFVPPVPKNLEAVKLGDDETMLRLMSGVKTPLKVSPLGTYDVLLELEQHPELGDLNDRKVFYRFNQKIFPLGRLAKLESVLLEVHFPDWDEEANKPFYTRGSNNLLNFSPFELSALTNVEITKFSRSKTENDEELTAEELRKGWFGVFYLSLEIAFGTELVSIENIALRIYANDDVRQMMTPELIVEQLTKKNSDGTIIKQYFRKQREILLAIEAAKTALHEHRNLCEDWCCISQVCVEDVAVCADVELAPDADIERVLAKMLYEIEDYFNPPIKFWSLQELIDAGQPVEEIFEGPSLQHGFIKTEELEAAQLKTVLRTSDIINRLMDIPGVLAVRGLLLTKYDEDGNPVRGAADGGADPKQISARWSLVIGERCQPRLHVPLSKFLFFKNDLPFLARPDEVQDTLSQLRGEAERLKIKKGPFDLPVPIGEFRSPETYFPVQYSLPLTYGVGFDGLPSRASALRQAQAKQLKGYLLFFEQLLANFLAQLSNFGKLFSLDNTVSQTYFFKDLRDETLIKGSEALMDAALDNPSVQHGLLESQPEFLERRNRFLDHLLGRFAESFSDYALALYSFEDNIAHTQEKLIADKISFLRDYPSISHDRAKAFNYRKGGNPANFPGLRKRIARQLGFDAAMEEQIIFVEHILLRPKFFGDALMQVCLDKDCAGCGDEDPYSFQMTIVMPGWQVPFDANLDLRRFADHTIRLETPAHILAKTCWVGNRGYELDACEPGIKKLAALLVDNGSTTDDKRPSFEQACLCAAGFFHIYQSVFIAWAIPKNNAAHVHKTPLAVQTELTALFAGLPDANSSELADCQVNLSDAALQPLLNSFMIAHYTEVFINGFQYSKFQTAWVEWLNANQGMDWCERTMTKRLEMALSKMLTDKSKAQSCACTMLAKFGAVFYERQRRYFENPETLERLVGAVEVGATFDAAFPVEPVITGCEPSLFIAPHASRLKAVFNELYDLKIFDVTEKLWLLLDLLSKLTSVYPTATLHDCDDGSDVNPVRLGSTALGR